MEVLVTDVLHHIDLDQEAAATPERVLLAVGALTRAARAAAGSDLREQITVTVSNRNMAVTVNAWAPESEEAVKTVGQFLLDPVGTAERLSPERAAHVAKALREDLERLAADGDVYLHGKTEPRRKLSKPLIEALRGLERLALDRRILRGTTTLRSRVLRFGRVTEARKREARIRVYGRWMEVGVHGRVASKLARAVDRDVVVDIKLSATWIHSDDGRWTLDPKRSSVVDVSDSDFTGLETGEWSTLGGVFSAARIAELLADEVE